MDEKLKGEVSGLKAYIAKKPLLNRLFEDEIRMAVKEKTTEKGWMIFITGLFFGLLIGYVVVMLMV